MAASMGVGRLGLEEDVSSLLLSRGIRTAGDLMLLTDLEAMETLDMSLDAVHALRRRVSRRLVPALSSALGLLRGQQGRRGVRTGVLSLDEALRGGLPPGSITEVVGPPGMGKTQFCMQAALLAALPSPQHPAWRRDLGGGGGAVVYFDTENKFSSIRIAQMAGQHGPKGVHPEETMAQVGDKILVTPVGNAADLTRRLSQLSSAMIDRGVVLIVVDSIAAHIRADFTSESMSARQSVLAEQAALLKQLAGDFSVPVLVTNQITTATGPLVSHAHQARSEVRVTAGQRLVAALGATWAHAVNTRVALLTRQGRRWAEIVKSPACPNMAVPYMVTSGGVQQDYSAQPENITVGSVLEVAMEDDVRYPG